MNTTKSFTLFLIISVATNICVKAQNNNITPPLPPFPITKMPEFNYMSGQDEQEILKKIPKDSKDDLELIKKNDKTRYYSLLREIQYKNLYLNYFFNALSNKSETKDNELPSKEIALNIKAEALAIKYKSANPSNKQAIRNQLRATLSELFELKEKNRKEEVAKLEKKLADLRKSLELRNSHKDEIINRKIEEMLGESKYYNWEQWDY
ncbi:hypothetical protein ABRY23_10875 [Melioribacteraceae bacterium 4301-Me]|uniref:hypothetical protein n=1 Tax=Pyranulibacter aquaticus TaxID=3163344 RepID=UPI003599F9D3